MNFNHVSQIVADAEAEAVEQLRRVPNSQEALARKRQIHWARGILEQASRLDLTGKEAIWELPPTLTQTPSSEYRVVEDHEGDDRTYWTEVIVGNERLRLLPGDLIIRRNL